MLDDKVVFTYFFFAFLTDLIFKSTIGGPIYKPPVDRDLVAYIDEIKEALRLQSPKNQAITLAR